MRVVILFKTIDPWGHTQQASIVPRQTGPWFQSCITAGMMHAMHKIGYQPRRLGEWAFHVKAVWPNLAKSKKESV